MTLRNLLFFFYPQCNFIINIFAIIHILKSRTLTYKWTQSIIVFLHYMECNIHILLGFINPFIVNRATYATFITIGVRTASIPYRLIAFGNTFFIICNEPFTSLLISNPVSLLNNPL